MLLFPFLGDWRLVTEDEVNLGCKAQWATAIASLTCRTNLGARASQVGAKHNNPRGLVIVVLTLSLEAILEQLHVSNTTVTALLELHLILHNERLTLRVEHTLERYRDGMVSSLRFSDQTLVTFDDRVLRRLLNGPLADETEGFTANWGFFCCCGG